MIPKTYADDLARWAGLQPEKPFLIAQGMVVTYAAMQEKMTAYAKKLRALPPRQTLLIIKKDPISQATAFLGAEKAGWVPVLGHPDLSPQAAELARKRQIGWLDNGEPIRPITGSAPVLPPEICMGVLSSGSTGLPKLLLRTYASWADFFPVQNNMFQVSRDTVAFCEGSLSFTGNSNLWASILYAGATLVFGRGLHPRAWLQDIRQYQADLLYLVPVKLKLLLAAIKDIYPAVHTILAGSQLLETQTVHSLKHFFPQSRIILYYGASELDYITWLTDEELLQHPGSVGRPCPGVQVSVQDGLICVDTPYCVAGLSRPCTLGDRGYFDNGGYLIFQGRQGQVINKGGLTISCSHVEQALQALSGVQDAAVVPLADKERGQDLGACLVLEKNQSIKEIRRALKTKLPAAEIPGKWAAVAAFPLTSAGKIDIKKVQEMLLSCT